MKSWQIAAYIFWDENFGPYSASSDYGEEVSEHSSSYGICIHTVRFYRYIQGGICVYEFFKL
jgi:hypothetical protein